MPGTVPNFPYLSHRKRKFQDHFFPVRDEAGQELLCFSHNFCERASRSGWPDEDMLTLSGQVHVLVDGLLYLSCGSGVPTLFPCTGSMLLGASRTGKSCLWQSQPAMTKQLGSMVVSHTKSRNS